MFKMVHRSSVVEMAAVSQDLAFAFPRHVGNFLHTLANTFVRHNQKEKDFFTRIRRYRVDPTTSSMQNPVPDYYGEKITSVLGYRNWLRDQRAFNKKRQSPV